MTTMGTLAWNRATHGVLRPQDWATLAAQGVQLQLRLLGEGGRRRLGLHTPALAALDLDALRLPDTAAAREAQRLCTAVYEPVVAAHSHRTYLWARILGAHDGLSWDDELLYVAALLHDLGLTAGYGRPEGPQRCFSLWGEAPTRELTARAGWSPERTEALLEAISLRLNVLVGLDHGPEAHLLHAGTGCDLAGIRLGQIDPVTRAAVVDRHPRYGFKREIVRICRERGDLPGSRCHFFLTLGRLEHRARSAPFPE